MVVSIYKNLQLWQQTFASFFVPGVTHPSQLTTYGMMKWPYQQKSTLIVNISVSENTLINLTKMLPYRKGKLELTRKENQFRSWWLYYISFKVTLINWNSDTCICFKTVHLYWFKSFKTKAEPVIWWLYAYPKHPYASYFTFL